MATALIVVGIVFLLAGLVVFLLPTSKTEAQAGLGDLQEVLKQVNALLEKFDKRYRPGLILMLVGLALVALGVYKQALDAKNAAEAPPVAAWVLDRAKAT